MVNRKDIEARINDRASQILKYAELAIQNERTFEIFRSRLLDELGHKGLRSDITALLDHGGKDGLEAWNGMGRSHTGRKGGAP